MKMKRFFTNKHKKKKSRGSGETTLDSKPVDLCNSPPPTSVDDEFSHTLTRAIVKKKQRNQRKKLNSQKSNDNIITENNASPDNNPTFVAPDGTKVVLRKDPSDFRENNSTLSPHRPRSHLYDDVCFPDSSSSSRTPSSASSSSSSRPWSARRPWSLVEPFRGQNPDDRLSKNFKSPNEFSDLSEEQMPSFCALPKQSDEDEFSSITQNRNKTMTLDFNFMRLFKRSSNPTVDHHRKMLSPSSASKIPSPQYYELTRPKEITNNKKKRLSWNDSGPFLHRLKNSSMSPHDHMKLAKKRSSTPADLLCSEAIDCSIPEEVGSNIYTRSSLKSQSEESSASTNTVTSISEFRSRTSSDCASIPSSNNLDTVVTIHSSESMLRCDKCLKLRQEVKINSCNCCDTSLGPQISIEDVDREIYQSSSYTKTKDILEARRTSASVGNLSAIGISETNLKKCDQTNFGGSLMTLPTNSSSPPKEAVSSTLPRQKCHPDKSTKLKLQSQINSIVYASSPQLNFPDRKSLTYEAPNQKERPKSTSIRFSEEDVASESFRSRASTGSSCKGNNAVVGSPIKRAIGFPGVVLRRHQNRRMKKSTQDLSKTSSNDCNGEYLSREARDKQVMSFNMEDLPTYEKMRDDPKWRTSTVSSAKASGRLSGDTGRARLRAAVLYHRYASHCTSSDDVSAIEFLLGEDQSIEELNNMDDDEFLDLYLSGPPANGSSRPSRMSIPSQEPSSKRVKTLRKSVASFANLISPGKPSRNKLQRSSSFKESSGSIVKPYRPPGSHGNDSHNRVSGSTNAPGRRSTGSTTKSRSSKLWSEIFDHSGLGEAELKRQEAIFELYQGDLVMVQDLKMAKQTYRDSMMTLKMLTSGEVNRIFGKLDCLLPLHEDLLSRLEKARKKDGRVDGVGHVFIEWFPTLSPYNEYCANQADAKETLDAVINRESRVRDFLQRCLESPFSRKLDLWSYLDLPRSRLVKYPLLLKAIQKATPAGHPDSPLLEKALAIINDIITRVDDMTGERQATYLQSKLEYLDDKQRCSEVDESRKIICSGQLKSNRGTKLHVFLFDLALVLTRNATRGEKLTYQVYRQPLPLKTLVVETEDGGKLSGSFRGGLLSNDKAKHSFRVRSEELNVAYTLIATDEHDKKQWINSLLEAISHFQPPPVELVGNRSPIPRRVGSEKSVLDKPIDKPSVSVKRSSSVKSEFGGTSPWFRRRSLTMSGKSVRRNSKDKKETVDLKKKSKMSPLNLRRNSKTESSDASRSSEFPLITLEEKLLIEEKNTLGRSRSLTSSPISFLANFPKRSPRRGSGLARSESCCLKPPSGKVFYPPHQYSLRSSTNSPSSSPLLSVTRSIPDLASYNNNTNHNDDHLSLEDVKKRLAPIKDATPPSIPAKKEESSSCATKPPEEIACTPPNSNNSSSSSLFHLTVDSPSHPAASLTSQSFPMAEEDLQSPMYKSVTISSCSPISCSSTEVSHLPLSSRTALQPHNGISTKDSDSESSSSESLDDVNPLNDDVAMILDRAGDEWCDSDRPCDDDVTPTNERTSPLNCNDDVLDILNDVVSRVCELQNTHPIPDKLSANCNEDFIIISSDDGLPWQGNDIEMTV